MQCKSSICSVYDFHPWHKCTCRARKIDFFPGSKQNFLQLFVFFMYKKPEFFCEFKNFTQSTKISHSRVELSKFPIFPPWFQVGLHKSLTNPAYLVQIIPYSSACLYPSLAYLYLLCNIICKTWNCLSGGIHQRNECANWCYILWYRDEFGILHSWFPGMPVFFQTVA